MNPGLQHGAAGSNLRHGVPAALLAQLRVRDRAYLTLQAMAPDVWLKARRRRQPGRAALRLKDRAVSFTLIGPRAPPQVSIEMRREL
jgi:hypothetical protein